MWLLLLLQLGLVATALASSVKSNLTYFGAPRASLDGVLPVLEIAEGYIRSQSNVDVTTFKSESEVGCGANSPCILGSCCTSLGHCGYPPEHCSPDKCVADCNAKAPCGEFSVDGVTSCPLNACCSRLGFCGVSDVFCRDVQSTAQIAGANDVPSCGKGSGSASRHVAYYQAWNSRRRPCDKVRPSQLDLSGITHLVLAFATIDPASFEVKLMNPDDDGIYKEFFALSGSVSKWIGLGGYEFTDPGENRKKFIDFLKKFLDKWDFKGIDIDWEWPGHDDRGGNAQDGHNQVELMKEMRQRLGSGFGLGVVIPAQYDHLKNMNVKGLEARRRDHHAHLRSPRTEIDASLKLLWSSNIDSKKVNMGLTNYGRGYTVADKSCMNYGCTFKGPSKQGSCSLQDGILSTCEIRRIVAEKKLQYSVIPGGAETNEVTWDDQWISFDDANTLGKKLELANDRCLGGTALWAIDYATCPGGGGSPMPGPGSSVAPSQSNSAPVSSAASSGASSNVPTNAPSTTPTDAPSPSVSRQPSGSPNSSQGSSAVSSPSAASSSVAGAPTPPPGAPGSPTQSSGASSTGSSSQAGSSNAGSSSQAAPSSSGAGSPVTPSPSGSSASGTSLASSGVSGSSASGSNGSRPTPTSGASSSGNSGPGQPAPTLGSSSSSGGSGQPAPSLSASSSDSSRSGQPMPTGGASSSSNGGSPQPGPTIGSSSSSGGDSPQPGPSMGSSSSSNGGSPQPWPTGASSSASSTDGGSPHPGPWPPGASSSASSTNGGSPHPGRPGGSSYTSSSAISTTSSVSPPHHPRWCPDECKTEDWCKIFCDKDDLDVVPPPQCWGLDWCLLWWGYSVHHHDDHKKHCKLLGCGCGFMGLPWGPVSDCESKGIKIPFFINIWIEIFGLFPVPCLFWGCPGMSCGLFGCGGWCFGMDECNECPKLLCPNVGPKIGPPPTPLPVPTPTKPGDKPGDKSDKSKKCEPKEYKTATERMVYCNEKVDLSSRISATTISTWASTAVTTAVSTSSSCGTVFDVTITGCNAVNSMSTMTTKATKSNSISSSSETPGPACTRAPLSLDDDEGNNIPEDNCQDCWDFFDDKCIPKECKPEDAEYCAAKCLTDMCMAKDSPKFCHTGAKCAHWSCPKESMGALPHPFPVTLTFP
ncbi:glycoside hydrolase [Ophiobolus disseminans]|uniref:chitinase n=1 Tax=Ophiobolus disseminans TaxID=1469910 RepID=A0A6A7A687_9PLEO|nr:glycoside hydrolase [Ophiobolus disseminans]